VRTTTDVAALERREQDKAKRNKNMSTLQWIGAASNGRKHNGLFGSLASAIGEWNRRLRDRRELAGLCERSLRDIGLSRYDALQEANKPFWRA
jgi:uncharacterized protein YjiS (DUF1127 family)